MAKRTDRISERPDPCKWDRDELMTLGEAARLHWPRGPITERTLRTAVRDGRLPISRLAGKFFVTRRALSSLSECTTARSPGAYGEEDKGHSYLSDLAALDRMGGK